MKKLKIFWKLQPIQDNYDPNFSWAIMRTLLSSEFYKGTYRGFPYCPPYLTEEQWNELQKIAHKNIKRAKSGRIYLFTSLIRCPVCGQLLCGTGCKSIINRKTREKRDYCYYRCSRAHNDRICTYRHRLSQNLIEQYLLDNLDTEYRKYQIRVKKIEEEKKKIAQTKTPEKLNAELERLNLLFQKGRVEWDYYSSEYDRIEQELKDLSKIKPEVKRDLSFLEDLLQSDFKTLYASLSPENRRAFWRSTIKQIHLNEDSTIKFVDFL